MRTFLLICALSLLVRPVVAQEGGLPAPPDTARVQTAEHLKNTMAIVGVDEVPGVRDWERQKSAKVAVLSSALLPGLGQAYNGRKWKAGIAFGLFTFYFGNAFIERQEAKDWLAFRDTFDQGTSEWFKADEFYQFHRETALDYLWWSGAVWFISMLDAFVDAHLYDVRKVDPDVFQSSGGQNYVGLSLDM